jgi:predicted permease
MAYLTSTLREIAAHIRGIFGKRSQDADIEDEFAAHLDLIAQENIRRGMSPKNARYAARRDFGGVEQIKEIYRERKGLPMLETLLKDLRFGARMLRKNPGFTLVAVLTLALGIGATTTMFAVVDAVLIRPLPYPQSNQIVHLTETVNHEGSMSIAYANYLDWQAMNRSFSAIGAIRNAGKTLTGSGIAEQLQGRQISHGFFGVLDIHPALGRDFAESDDRPFAAPTAILSYQLWQRRFSGNPNIVGHSVVLDGESHTVIGVLPHGFSYNDETPDVFVPIGLVRQEAFFQNRFMHAGTFAIARLKPGVTLANSRTDLDRVAQVLQQKFPATNSSNWVGIEPLSAWVIGDMRTPLLILLAAVGMLLLIACGNTANLLLAKGSARTRELAIRVAVGATRVRLLCQLLTESMLLTILGGAAGILLAFWATSTIVASAPDSLPRVAEINLSADVLAFAVAVALLTGIIFGIVPALRIPVGNEHFALRESERGNPSRSQQRVRAALIVGQIALSLALLLGAGLLLRSFRRVMEVDPGFDAHQLLTGNLNASAQTYKTVADTQRFYDAAMANVRAIPGVVSASAVSPMPMTGNEWDADFLLEGSQSANVRNFSNSEIGYFGPDYPAVMRVPLLAGRAFTDADTPESMPVAVVNQEFVHRFCADQNPIGRRIRIGDPKTLSGPESARSRWQTVVGVIGNVKQYGLDRGIVSTVYTPLSQTGTPGVYMNLVIRTSASDPLLLASALRQAIAKIDRDQAVADISTMDQRLSSRLASRQLSMILLAIFAALALALGAVGIYSVVAYTVARRTPEIGIRMALGAPPSSILRAVLWQGLKMAAVGIAIGVAIALAATRIMQNMLFQVKPNDPVTYGLAIAVVLAITLAACFVPARRAMRVDPIQTLRHE